MTAPSASVRACLNQWRDKLIDLSRRNPLLYLRPTKTSFLTLSQSFRPTSTGRRLSCPTGSIRHMTG